MIESLRKDSNFNQLEHELEIAKEHGKQRLEFGNYSLDQVILEYQILRQVLFESLEVDRSLVRSERDLLTDIILFSIRKAASEFHRVEHVHRDLAEEAMKREHATERDRSRYEVLNLEEERMLRETFVSTLSHDLRTPLTLISFTAQLLVKSLDRPEKVSILVGRILESVQRADGMIQDLLDSSRVRAGERLHLVVSEFNLMALVKEVADEMSSLQDTRFVVEGPDAIEGHWDHGGIRRILENLFKNAIKYGAPEAPITVRISEQNARVSIVVHNEGEPIPMEDQASLFQPFIQPFRRTSVSHSGKEKGWGLGLTVVRGMAEAHRGSVEVRSNSEHGTTFIVWLPKDARSA
jgi:signal transduction histidine kinase